MNEPAEARGATPDDTTHSDHERHISPRERRTRPGASVGRTRSPNRSRWAALGAAVAVTLGAGGGFGFANAVQESGTRSTYTPISPCRLTDTRSTNQIGPRNTPIGPGETITIAARGAQGRCTATDLPGDATALVLNVTALGATSQTFLTFWPDGPQPEAASLNPSPGAPPNPNAVTTQLANDGGFRVFNERGAVNVVIDVAGYYTDHNHDDRYYTKTQADVLFGSTGPAIDAYTKSESDARFATVDDTYTKSETDAAILAGDDNLLNVLVGPGGPVKINTQDIATLEALVDSGAPLKNQVVVVSRLEFRPFDISSATAVQNTGAIGAFIPGGASNNELWATVDLPVGAQVSTMNVRLVDDIGGTSLDVEYRVNGVMVSEVQTSGSPGDHILGMSPNHTVAAGDVIEIRVQAFGLEQWSTEGDGLQVVRAFIVYDEAGG